MINIDILMGVNKVMEELKTWGELKTACEKEGFILIIQKPIKKSHIHSTSGYLHHTGIHDSKPSDCKLGQSKAKQRYYFSDSIDELNDKLKSSTTRDIENLQCKCVAIVKRG